MRTNMIERMFAKKIKIVRILIVLIGAMAFFAIYQPPEVYAATTVELKHGDTYDFSEKSNYKKYGAFYVDIKKSGEYRLKGSARNAMVRIDPPEGQTVIVRLQGLELKPDDTAPGSGSDRAPIEIGGSGGTVHLISDTDTRSNITELWGQGRMPAIRKDNTTTKLIFDTASSKTAIIAHADPDAFRTCAIGCHNPNLGPISGGFRVTTGNIVFKNGKIEAYGSRATSSFILKYYEGGPGIGANGYGDIDGITFEGGEIYAEAGDTGSAAIGTASGMTASGGSPLPWSSSGARNITINGGKITTAAYRDFDRTETLYGKGASIGAGNYSVVENLKINGGEINVPSKDGVTPAVGIGAGEDGRAKVEINGGKINIQSTKVGIGTFAVGKIDIGNGQTAWYGDAQITINNGDISVSSSVCIGCSDPTSDKTYVLINGGNLDLHARKMAIGPYSANTGGRVQQIRILGGVINAHSDYVDDEEYQRAVIGGEYSGDRWCHDEHSSHVNLIEITGGTLNLTQGDRKNPELGKIGGAGIKGDSYTKVVISGGNVSAGLLGGEKSRPVSSSNGARAAPVYLQKINLQGGSTPYNREAKLKTGTIPLKYNNGEDYLYGLNDVYTFKGKPQLWFWMPANAEKGSVTTEEALYKDLDAREYTGLLKNNGKGETFDFYPPIHLNLLHGGNDPTRNGSAKARLGYKELTDFLPADDSGDEHLIETYDSSATGGFHVIDRLGKLIAGTDNRYLDEKGRWSFVGKTSGAAFDPDLFKETAGLDLYAIRGDSFLDLSYDGNVPENTESVMQGDLPEEKSYKGPETISIPGDSDISLKGYRFKGWNTAADGKGKSYRGNTEVTVHDLRPDTTQTAKVTLYAQWEPIEYEVTYSAGSAWPDLEEKTRTYTYDKAETVLWTDELEDWVFASELLLAWKYKDGDEDRFYIENQKILNFVDFDDKGNPVSKTLTAEFLDMDETYVHVTKDGHGVSGLDNDIYLTEEGDFKEVTGIGGLYICTRKDLTKGEKYTVHFKDMRTNGDMSILYGVGYCTRLHSFTTKLSKGEHATKVNLEPCDGEDEQGRPYVVAPSGYRLTISSELKGYYTGTDWKVEGTEPKWISGTNPRVIEVCGTSVLTPDPQPLRPTITFLPNGGEGEMAPQSADPYTKVKLNKSTLKKAGYAQSGWSFVPDPQEGQDDIYRDEAEIEVYENNMTLHAIWTPVDYEVTYHDPSNTFSDAVHRYKYDKEGDSFPALSDTDTLPGWGERTGYDFGGWRESGNAQAGIHKPGDALKNLCTVNEDRTVTGKTMDAVWTRSGNIFLTLTKDDSRAKGLASKISLKDKNGTIYGDLFTEDPDDPGRYIYSAIESGDIAKGEYTLSIDGYILPESKGTFSYDPAVASVLDHEFYTVKVISDDYISATVNGKTDPAVVLKGEKVEIDAVPVEGCSFDGWSWLGDEGKPDWEEDKDETFAKQKITVKKPLELMAHADGIIYTVRFDANDSLATGTMEDQDMKYGEPQILFANRFLRTGYSFAGWNTRSDGKGDYYRDRESVKDLTTRPNDVVVLYAQWEPMTYKITYIDPYRLCDTYHQTVKYDEQVQLLAADAPGWQPAGHTLSTWQGQAFGSTYSPGQQVTNLCTVKEDGSLSDTVLYASWVDEGNIRVTITLDDKGVNVDSDDIELISEEDSTSYKGCFLMENDAPGNYMFDPSELAGQSIPEGYYTVHVDNHESYGLADVRATVAFDPAKAASAVLQSNTVMIEAGDNVSSVSVKDPVSGKSGNSVVVEYGEEAEISAVVDEEGYHFDSYAISGNIPSMDPLEPVQRIIVYGAVKLTAQAAPNVYKIHYDPNEGEGEISDQTVTYGHEYTVAGDVFTRVHYDMTGWNTKADGNGMPFRLNEKTDLSLTSVHAETVTLYAQWKIKPEHSITFDLGGGVLDGKTGSVVIKCFEGDEITIPGAPSKRGYKFKYWKGSMYYPGDKYTVTEPHKFTAIYAKESNGNSDEDEGDDDGGGGSSNTDPTNGGKDDNGSSGERSSDDGTGTGDDSRLLLMILMTILSIGGATTVLTRRRISKR